ncbi:hypothetical protein EUTSA_v10027471mg [Eutrema salsugineum]|uniref:F-box domain-containing protein n=1 Tax=Eutrema salsugineum TaxID=72664 RepID=V4ML52_EUTSA|nr:hypothetical protein EUTSA_v10027471mg [Eutrema salsugineum]
MSDLPEDLLEEILCRVPAIPLKRLRSTCKRWNRLFNDKRFTRKHIDTAAKQSLILLKIEKKLRIFSLTVDHKRSPSIDVKGELSLIDPRSSLDQFQISKVSHCDGLLLCTNKDNTRLVVWNPCTGQTRWIQPLIHHRSSDTLTLGSYQDKKSGNKSYKILRYNKFSPEQRFEIYEINSGSWRIVKVTPNCRILYTGPRVSLKGKAYWFGWDIKENYQYDFFLVCFDFTTERFGRMRLPYQHSYQTMSLSVVREEKLSMLLQRTNTQWREIWVTNKIGYQTMSLSVVREEKLSVLLQRTNTQWREIWVTNKIGEWTRVLTILDSPPFYRCGTISFLVDEEKKVVVCCEKKVVVYIAGEDNKVTQVDFGEAATLGKYDPVIHSYVPSLVQIQ